MIITPHAIVGASISNIFQGDLVVAFVLAFLSHYLLDMMPHTDYDITGFMDKETRTVRSIFDDLRAATHLIFIFIDFIVAAILCILFFVRGENSLYITLVGVFAALLPDFFQFMFYKFKNQPWIFFQKVHDRVHHLIKFEHNNVWGIIFQIIVPLIFIFIYFLIRI
jgi:hypothetical protein